MKNGAEKRVGLGNKNRRADGGGLRVVASHASLTVGWKIKSQEN